jgi:hypothetical protein
MIAWLWRRIRTRTSAAIEVTLVTDPVTGEALPFVVVTSHLKLRGRYIPYAYTWWSPNRAIALGQSVISAAGKVSALARAENGEVDEDPAF